MIGKWYRHHHRRAMFSVVMRSRTAWLTVKSRCRLFSVFFNSVRSSSSLSLFYLVSCPNYRHRTASAWSLDRARFAFFSSISTSRAALWSDAVRMIPITSSMHSNAFNLQQPLHNMCPCFYVVQQMRRSTSDRIEPKIKKAFECRSEGESLRFCSQSHERQEITRKTGLEGRLFVPNVEHHRRGRISLQLNDDRIK